MLAFRKGTLYLVLRTSYIFKRLDTSYSILFLMSNAERPVQIIECKYNVPSTRYKVGIRIWTRILPLKDMLAFRKGT